MSEQLKQVVLLPGTGFGVGLTFTTLLPDTTDAVVGDVVTLTNEQLEALGTAEVIAVIRGLFCSMPTPGYESYDAALVALKDLVPGFSQIDEVEVISLNVLSVIEPGLVLVAGDVIGDVDLETGAVTDVEVTDELMDSVVASLQDMGDES